MIFTFCLCRVNLGDNIIIHLLVHIEEKASKCLRNEDGFVTRDSICGSCGSHSHGCGIALAAQFCLHCEYTFILWSSFESSHLKRKDKQICNSLTSFTIYGEFH